MKRIFLTVCSALLLVVSIASASYTYFITENLAAPNWSNWTVTGTMTPVTYTQGGYSGIGPGSFASPSGTMVSNTSSSFGEVRMTIRTDPSNANASSFSAMFEAGTSYSTGETCAGYYLTVSMSGNAGYASVGVAGATALVLDPTNSFYIHQYSTLAQTSTYIADGAVVRAVVHGDYPVGTQIFVYINNSLVLSYIDLTSNPHAGGCGNSMGLSRSDPIASDGTLISELDLGYSDTTPPNAIPVGSINTAAYTNHIDMNWPATTDDTNGSGVYSYSLYRGGQLLGSGPSFFSFSDTTVVPNTTYSYTVSATDYHGNAASTNFNVTTPHVGTNGPFPSATPDGRRVGVRPTGAYWGGGNENIDVLSGNLNFALPMLKALGRGGWGVPFNLVYNSQNWRQDSGGAWNFGYDVGYGYGWRLLAGSITPVWNSGGFTANYYLFTDSNGSEYRLDQNNSNVWSSKESIYVWFDANTNVLHFRDGSVWNFACISAGSEPDSGVMHPTLIQDTNGNQILIRYQQATGAGWANSSARITQVEDVRATSRGSGVYASYDFTYNTDAIPHLTSITNSIGTGEAYNFSYTGGQSLVSPINSQSFGTTTWLSSAVVANLNATHVFSYDGSGELTKVMLPYGGYLAYDYSTTSYSGGPSYREVAHRYLSPDGTFASQLTYPLTHESSPVAPVHQFTTIDDPSGNGEKFWAFGTSGIGTGLVMQYQGRQLPGPLTQTQNDLVWVQDAVGNSYIGTAYATSDPSQSYSAKKATNQAMDIFGNVTSVQNYDFGAPGSGNIGSLLQTYNYTYLNSSAYTSLYIYNRLTQASVTVGTTTTILATNTYDVFSGSCTPSPLTSVSGLREWSSAYTTSFTTRGNVVCSSTPSGGSNHNYDQAGNVVNVTTNGVTAQVSTSGSTNFAAPSQFTVGGLTTSLGWNSFLGLTSETGPNGDSAATTYDAYARASGTTSPFGASTTVTYTNFTNPPTTGQTATTTTNGRWTRKTMDGLGHPILVETGDGSGTKSKAESVYAPCACSPMLKLKQQAMPHAPGTSPVWTTYTYDGIGRTVSTLASDNASTTAYSYQGNTVTTTDAAGKWKKFTMDGLGNLTQVVEPDPANPTTATYSTTYAYDLWNNLTQVTMPRPTGTQTRTFTYIGRYLQSATNPENGTVSYTYNSNGKIASKTDAKSQQILYSYDSYARLTKVQRGAIQNGSFVEDTCQQENYYYDTNTFDSSYSQYASGRLTAVQYYGANPLAPNSAANPSPYSNASTACGTTYTEMYNYSQPGGEVGKRLRVTRWLQYSNNNDGVAHTANSNVDLNATFAYDNEGRMTSTQFPNSGPNVAWAYDSMGRFNTMTETISGATIISGATYGPSSELLTLSGSVAESRTYNSMLQLTNLTSNGVNMTYGYSATQNNGKITSQTDNISGEQVVYTYDALNRLASAQATSAAWGQSYAYDGFGNLTDQNVIAGSAPSYHVVPNAATNHLGTTDLNGNPAPGFSYDIENRLLGGGGYKYVYAPGNKRAMRSYCCTTETQTGLGLPAANEEITFWSVTGQRMATYQLAPYSYFGNATQTTATVTSGSNALTVASSTGVAIGQTVEGTGIPANTTVTNVSGLTVTMSVNATASGTGVAVTFLSSSLQLVATQTGTWYYFGRKLIKNKNGYIGADRLGSIGKYYPYGREKPSATMNGTEKFTGYLRDTETGLDYADQRYHVSGTGRFLTPDPFNGSFDPRNPLSWNRYSYVTGDPINRTDPTGLDPLSCLGDMMGDAESGNNDDPNCSVSVSVSITFPSVCGPGEIVNQLGNCDVPLSNGALTVISLINQANPGAFIDSSAIFMLGLPASAFLGVSFGAGQGAASLAASLSVPVAVIGRLADTFPLAGNALYNVFQTALEGIEMVAADQAWVQSIINSGQSVSVVSMLTSAETFNGGAYNEGFTMFGVELGWFINAGYTLVGGYLVPPVH
jgi:RHS repeat-associated protein